MKLLRDWRTFRSLGAERRRLIVEACVLGGAIWLGLRVLPFTSLRRMLDAWAVRAVPGPQLPATAIGWAVAAVASRSPARTCLIEALTADAMLRRRRHESILHLGVRKTEDRLRPLDGHAWVECNGVIVVGHLEDLAKYSGAVWTAATIARGFRP
jgi:Transglutaminase-like superfamily